MIVSGFSSTGSKRPFAIYGAGYPSELPIRMLRSQGAHLWDPEGRQYLDFIMALGAVTLGYGHPAVGRAAKDAIDRGVVGSLAPVQEERLARRLKELLPWIEGVRFFKTGAEAVAAAVRLARAATGRDRVIGCGYHGWLDWSSSEPGVPAAVRELYAAIPFGDPEPARTRIREAGDDLAAVVVEPVVDGPPTREWLACLRSETERVGAVLVFDEIKTGFRLAVGGAVERWGVVPDLAVYGKALGSGFPLAAVAGPSRIMDQVGRTWISSTLATEFVALAAARAALDETVGLRVPEHLGRVGALLHQGLVRLADRFPAVVTGVAGLPEMCYLRFRDEAIGSAVAVGAARRGLLFKRSAYNYVSLAHSERDISSGLGLLEDALVEAARC
jgi:glutamate-1-semialdehyde 2,1-aminomutase